MPFARLVLACSIVLALPGCGHAATTRAVTAAAGTPTARGWDPTSTVMGDCPNFAQASNGNMMTVVSREEGRGAKAGALIELYYPTYAHDHLWDAYVGVEVGGKPRWAHDMQLEGQAIAPDTGRITSRFGTADVGLVLEDVVDPDHDVHVRHVTVTNRGAAPLHAAKLDAYAFFTINELPGGDRLRYDAASHALVQSEGNVAIAMAADVAPDGWHCGLANLPAGPARDAREAAEHGQWDGRAAAGPAATGVNGALRLPLPELAPGASATVTLSFAAAANEPTALLTARNGLASGWAAVAGRDASRWAAWLGGSLMPTGLDDRARAVYRRALIAIEQHCASNGAIVAAATNLSPLYRFVWPRDGVLTSLALTHAGHPERARAFLAFAEKLQRPDGGFAVNYLPDGSRALWEFGVRGDEHDQAGLFAWGVGQLADDTAFAAARWPAVRRACEFLLAQQRADGLLGPCRDLWELDTDESWTFSNGAAWAGLRAGATLATRQGDNAAAARFTAGATRLEAAIAKELVVDGRYARGTKAGRPDPALEVANLALGHPWFGLVPDTDPRLATLGRDILARLATPDGGVRRHEGDHYYGGQPWPVTTGWLALHEAAAGDRAAARARLETLTRYAGATGSLMLGEQFDEGRQHWVSAFPLTWSEATYVDAALALGKGP